MHWEPTTLSTCVEKALLGVNSKNGITVGEHENLFLCEHYVSWTYSNRADSQCVEFDKANAVATFLLVLRQKANPLLLLMLIR